MAEEEGKEEGRRFGMTLRRRDTGQPWGFRLTGGKDLDCSLYIAKVTPRSLSARAGMKAGDVVLQIERVPATHLTHDHAKAEILRAGNDLHLILHRKPQQQSVAEDEDPLLSRRSVVVEEQTEYKGDPNPTSQSRTFHLLNYYLQDELEELSKAPAKESKKAVNGPQPSSTATQGPVQGATYSAAGTPSAETTTQIAQGSIANPDRPKNSPLQQQPVQASIAPSSEASPKNAASTAAIASSASKTEDANKVPKSNNVGSVDAKVNKPNAALSAGAVVGTKGKESKSVSADSEANVSSSDNAQKSSSEVSAPAVSLGAENSVTQATSAAAAESPQVSDVTEVVLPADAEANVSLEMSAEVTTGGDDVTHSVDVEAPLTIVAIDDNEDDVTEGDSADYSDADDMGSEGSDEAATFTIQMT